MQAYAEKPRDIAHKSAAERNVTQRRSPTPGFQVADNRPAAITQRKLASGIHSSPKQTIQRQRFQALYGNAVQLQAEPEDELQMKANVEVLQRAMPEEEEEEKVALQGRFESVQYQANTSANQRVPDPTSNNTGLPDNLKNGIETLSGYSMDDVNVHYNSPRPAQLNAYAYAQGADIHLASGQEKHLPHEAWHVVQQKQGRVKPTMQMKVGTPVNDDPQLEKEADVMGEKALRMNESSQIEGPGSIRQRKSIENREQQPVQRKVSLREGDREKNINLANVFMLKELNYGITPVILNNVRIPGGNPDNAINPPTFNIERKTESQFELSVSSTATNVVGYEMQLPADPPWLGTSTIKKLNVYLGLQNFSINSSMYDDESEVATVNIKGMPSDKGFAGLVEQHENKHVQDLWKIVAKVLLPWDMAINSFEQEKKKIQAKSAGLAEKEFYQSIGGTPEEIGKKMYNALRDAGDAYHRTKEGGMPVIDSTTYLREGKLLRVYLKSPLG